MRSFLLVVWSGLVSICFQLSVLIWPQSFQAYAPYVKWAWVLTAVILVVWAISHPSIIGRVLGARSQPSSTPVINFSPNITFSPTLTNTQSGPALTSTQSEIPSLIFVFGAPLGDNNSASWIMPLKHYGPGQAHNCTLDFYDDDRKNIEHEWLVKHPDTPFLPLGTFDKSQERVHVQEAGPEGSVGSFHWNPPDPNRQHYSVSIDCRDGVFVEKFQVTRVDGVLRARIRIEHGPMWIENNPGLDPVVFEREDQEFVSTPLLSEIPKTAAAQKVHPGWKPNYKFGLPVAIIDPNGNVQVANVKFPDGVLRPGTGCWEILTKHFGDKPK